MYQKENSSWVKHADFTICDMLCLQLAFVLAYWIRNGIDQPYETELYRNVAVVMFLIQLMVTFFNESFSGVLRRGMLVELKKTFEQCTLVCLLVLAYMFLLRIGNNYSRMILLITYVLYICFSYCGRQALKKFLKDHRYEESEKRSLLIVTVSENADNVVETIRKNNYGTYHLAGIVFMDCDKKGASVCGVPVVAGREDMISYIHKNWIDEVFFAVRFRIKYFCAKSGILFRDFMKIASPAVINDVVWSFASSAFAAILGHIGDDMVAANAVAVMVVNIGAIACRGFANATTIIISQELGKDHKDTAREYGKRMLRITIIVSLIGCAIILAVRPMILDFYRDKLTETAIYYLGIFIIMTTWRLVGEGINTCLICGCFRGGGDSRFGMIVDSIFMWLVAVPLTFLAAYVLKLPPVWVYFIMTLDEFEKMPVVFIHYFRNKWLTNITRDFD